MNPSTKPSLSICGGVVGAERNGVHLQSRITKIRGEIVRKRVTCGGPSKIRNSEGKRYGKKGITREGCVGDLGQITGGIIAGKGLMVEDSLPEKIKYKSGGKSR